MIAAFMVPKEKPTRANYLQNEIEIALRNAKAADTLGRYDLASWWEQRAIELSEELGNLQLESDNANIHKEKTDDVIDRSLEELRP